MDDRDALVAAAKALDAAGFMPQKSGNLSLRTATGFLITPSGLPYAAMGVAELVACAPDGAPLSPGRPSSEWRLHAAIYRARGPMRWRLVHTHSPPRTSLHILSSTPSPTHQSHSFPFFLPPLSHLLSSTNFSIPFSYHLLCSHLFYFSNLLFILTILHQLYFLL
jgi:ribulose-5-phosphate 4-epimerase/fuculose-1-phosphate aldolase